MVEVHFGIFLVGVGKQSEISGLSFFRHPAIIFKNTRKVAGVTLGEGSGHTPIFFLRGKGWVLDLVINMNNEYLFQMIIKMLNLCTNISFI